MGSQGFFLLLGNLSQSLSSRPAGTGAREGDGLEGWRPGRGEGRGTAQGGQGKEQTTAREVGVYNPPWHQGLVGKSRQVS